MLHAAEGNLPNGPSSATAPTLEAMGRDGHAAVEYQRLRCHWLFRDALRAGDIQPLLYHALRYRTGEPSDLPG